MNYLRAILVTCGMAALGANAQERPVMAFPSDGVWKQSFDTTEGRAGTANRELRAALYVYSMLNEQGIDDDQIHVALVVHGSATFDFLSDDRYRAHYGEVANPNAALLKEFVDLGGEVWMSEFGLTFREISVDDLLPGVGLTPAALVAHAELARQGFSQNPFDASKFAAAPQFAAIDGPFPLSKSVRVNNVLYLSGDLGIDADGKGLIDGGIEPESRRVMARIGEKLAEHDLDYEDLFKCSVFLADMDEWAAFNAIYKTYFPEGRYPVRSAFAVSGLAADARVEMECMAWAN